MTIEQTEVIDAIGTVAASGEGELTIFDHLPWTDGHFEVLEKKLTTYVRFVKSGQLLEVRPSAKGAAVVVSLIAKYRPTSEAIRRLQGAVKQLSGWGLLFRYGPLPTTGYFDEAG